MPDGHVDQAEERDAVLLGPGRAGRVDRPDLAPASVRGQRDLHRQGGGRSATGGNSRLHDPGPEHRQHDGVVAVNVGVGRPGADGQAANVAGQATVGDAVRRGARPPTRRAARPELKCARDAKINADGSVSGKGHGPGPMIAPPGARRGRASPAPARGRASRAAPRPTSTTRAAKSPTRRRGRRRCGSRSTATSCAAGADHRVRAPGARRSRSRPSSPRPRPAASSASISARSTPAARKPGREARPTSSRPTRRTRGGSAQDGDRDPAPAAGRQVRRQAATSSGR